MLVTRLARESGSMTATTRTSGYSVSQIECMYQTLLAHEVLTLDLSNDLVNVIEVLGLSTVGDAELSVRSQSSTIPVRQVVHDDLDEVFLSIGFSFGGGIGKVCPESGYF